MDDGAGTLVRDYSGNSKNGTATAVTYSDDRPTQKRKFVGDNLIYNGNFEYAPPANVDMTSAAVNWIDGTVGGSSTNKLFGWLNYSGTAGKILFDNTDSHSGLYSLKVSNTVVGSAIQAGNVTNNAGIINGLGAANVPLIPSTPYTLTFWMKTQLNSGSSATGAGIYVRETSGTGSQIVQSGSIGAITTTTGWTKYTYNFTANAATRYVILKISVEGNNGAATLLMDAWFDDIVLLPTTNIMRS
jgi:hypothetical protein